MAILKRLKSGWMAFALWLGRVQTAILLTIVYHLTVGPISIVARLIRRDPMGLRIKGGGSHAVSSPHVTVTLERARKQF